MADPKNDPKNAKPTDPKASAPAAAPAAAPASSETKPTRQPIPPRVYIYETREATLAKQPWDQPTTEAPKPVKVRVEIAGPFPSTFDAEVYARKNLADGNNRSFEIVTRNREFSVTVQQVKTKVDLAVR